jgi:uncharacterized protein with PIN domain
MKIGRPKNYPAGFCSKCGSVSGYRTDSGTDYCIKHRRFMQMKTFAKSVGKTVPSYDELESLLPADMKCPVCGRSMTWLASEGKPMQVSLQHDRDGTHRLICLGCNSRHAALPGDLLYSLKEGEKYCQSCKVVKKATEFHKSNARTLRVKLGSRCKECNRAQHADWVRRNRDRVNEYQRRYREERR